MEIIDANFLISKDLRQLGYKVALNKANTIGLPQFHTQGVGNSVPDLFFWDPSCEDEIFNNSFVQKKLMHIRAGFIEAKDGQHLGDLFQAVYQNTRYFGYFLTNRAKFFLNGKQVHNVDVFVLATSYSRIGMLYKEDENQIPTPISYMSERYNFIVYPYTNVIHSLQRYCQKVELNRLRNDKEVIASNKMNVQTGIMISKVPLYEGEKISYEYYTWLGKILTPVQAKLNNFLEYISTEVKLLFETENSKLRN